MDESAIDVVKGKILVVDDTPTNVELLIDFLPNWGYKVEAANCGMAGLNAAKTFAPDLILLDIKMPDINGYEVCQRLKADPTTQDIPVVFLSALNEVLDKVKAFEVGGVDYMTKPLQLREVLVRVENQMSLLAAKAEIRKLNTDLEERVKLRTAQLEQEIQKHISTQKQLQHLAFHDPLTDLPNRSLFIDRLAQSLKRIKYCADYSFAVLFLDCDRFKFINESLGHLLGDMLLVEFSDRLKQKIRSVDSVARFGGDEFSILLEELEDPGDAIAAANHIIESLYLEPFILGDKEIFINVSIGIVFGNPNYDLPDTILRDADTAMYQAKANGKACYQVFHPDMHVLTRKVFELQTDLRLALEQQQFLLYYQPVISLATGDLVGFEALIRWNHPTEGFIPPSQFIPVAEETGLIAQIGEWTLREACSQIKAWQEKFEKLFSVRINVNLSVKQFSLPDLMDRIDRILADTGVSGNMLKLEITETAIMDNAESADLIIKQLREREIQLCIDDFGTGYSSLNYLHRFPVKTLKIDRSFISIIEDSNLDRSNKSLIVQAIVTLAHQLGMDVVAEGVETLEQAMYLKQIGCEFAQGYYFEKPLPPTLAEKIIIKGKYLI
ncbi:EAL domain-containing protein [Tumidithrix elongata RA019]|uniref:EAL domain-containing protein n=2 Tax=Tumidithrix TaxID=3088355 RepID=A0AAW9Q4Y2_9CYAN|nr:EAL domain-containing protein [Tumidithrix elongata RA019]